VLALQVQSPEFKPQSHKEKVEMCVAVWWSLIPGTSSVAQAKEEGSKPSSSSSRQAPSSAPFRERSVDKGELEFETVA
jgi:hypothetical protein